MNRHLGMRAKKNPPAGFYSEAGHRRLNYAARPCYRRWACGRPSFLGVKINRMAHRMRHWSDPMIYAMRRCKELAGIDTNHFWRSKCT